MQASFSCSEQGLLCIVVCSLLIEVASLDTEHRSRCSGFSSCSMLQLAGSRVLAHYCSTRAQQLQSIWDPSVPEVKPVSLALQGKFLTTGQPGKPCLVLFLWMSSILLCVYICTTSFYRFFDLFVALVIQNSIIFSVGQS